ncbi:hypothetical protein N9L22_04080 [Candidatus Poseidonia alphae]|nr:hypothetical protein [Candidatus Poseidonia alphae]
MSALILTTLLVLSTIAFSASTNAQETTSRTTGNEDLTVSLTSGTKHIERDSSFTLTVLASNLDMSSEYTLELSFCEPQVDSDWNPTTQSQEFTHNCHDLIEHESIDDVDLGSGNSFVSTIITIDDPGLYANNYDSITNEYVESGLYNETYLLYAELTIQGAPVTSNSTNPFVLGGEADEWDIDGLSNVLIGNNLNIFGRVIINSIDQYVDHYQVDCGIYAQGASVASTSASSTQWISHWHDFDFEVSIPSPTTAGTHFVMCDLIRNSDSASMGTMTSENIEVIDEDYTGLEHVTQNGIVSKHIERTDSTNTVQIQATFDFEELFPGTTYALNITFCEPQVDQNWNTTTQSHDYIHHCYDLIDDRDGTSVGIDFTPTLSTDSITITIDDPGLYANNYDSITNEYVESGLYNETYLLYAELTIQGAPVTSNSTNPFVLGGEADEWDIDGLSNVLIGNNLNIFGRVIINSIDQYVDHYQVDCGIYAQGASVASTSASSTQWISHWHDFDFEVSIPSPTTAGTHFVMCDLIRNSDSASMGTMTSENIEVIDDTSNQDDASMAVSVAMHATEGWGTVTISAVDLDAGQEYRFDWVVEDNAASPATVMMQNDHIWVAGNDGTHTYDLPFHDLADTTDACIIVVFKAGTTELATDSSVCWISASTADGDGDGVYDKNDLCENTPASATVQSDGCSDSDGDGVDSTIETECGSDPNDINSVPADLDNDGTCDLLDTDADGDGALNVDEIAAGTDPMDANSFPSNMLPTCAVYYSLEVDGMPTSFEGDAAIPALSGATAQAGVSSLTPPVITVPAGSYYITAHCIDTDGDDITVTVNDITVGPIAGEVSAGAIIVIGEDVDETLDVTVSWTDGTDTLTAIITVNMDGDSGTTVIPGFGFTLGMMSIMLAGFVALRREQE